MQRIATSFAHSRVLHVLTLCLLVALAGFVIYYGNGCTQSDWAQVQRRAVEVQYVTASPGTVANPATQPAAQDGLNGARAIYQIAAGSNPTVQVIGTIIGVLAAAVGAAAGHMTGSSTATARATAEHQAVLTEVVNDVRPDGWHQPHQPFSAETTAVLQRAGLRDAAVPTSLSPAAPIATPLRSRPAVIPTRSAAV